MGYYSFKDPMTDEIKETPLLTKALAFLHHKFNQMGGIDCKKRVEIKQNGRIIGRCYIKGLYFVFKDSKSGQVWVVDPRDGTLMFELR